MSGVVHACENMKLVSLFLVTFALLADVALSFTYHVKKLGNRVFAHSKPHMISLENNCRQSACMCEMDKLSENDCELNSDNCELNTDNCELNTIIMN